MSQNPNARPSKRSGSLHPVSRLIDIVCAHLKMVLTVFAVITITLAVIGAIKVSVTAVSDARDERSNLESLKEYVEIIPATDTQRRDRLYAATVMTFGVSEPRQAALHALQSDLREGEGQTMTEEAYEAASTTLVECAQKRSDAGRYVRNTRVFFAALEVAEATSSSEAASALKVLTTLAPPVVEMVDESAKIINADTCARKMMLEIPF